MNRPNFSDMSAKDYITKYGIKNAMANFTPYYRGSLLFLIPADVLPEVAAMIDKINLVTHCGGYEKTVGILKDNPIAQVKDAVRRNKLMYLNEALVTYISVYGKKEI